MKTFLKLASLVLAIGIPAGFAIELAGVSVPAALEPLPLFLWFVTSLTILTVLADYGHPMKAIALQDGRGVAPAASPAREAQPLAA